MDHWLLRAAAMRPDRLAVSDRERALTYAQLASAALQAAGGLGRLGVGAGDRVALSLPAGVEFVIALHACMLAGAPVVPIDLRLSDQERRVRKAGVKAVLSELPVGDGARTLGAGAGALGAGAGAPGAADLDSVVAVLYTSGSTAAPKPVQLTRGNFLHSALGSAVALGLDSDERWLCPMPLTHVGGLSTPIRSVIYGTTAIVHERFETEAVAAALSDPGQRVTLVSLVPTMLARLLDAGLRDPPTLRWALLGGGPISDALLQRAANAGVPVAPTYGMTEACSQIATHGWPLPGVELELAPDGEILVRGGNVAPAAPGADGWLHTGDLGAFDERGRLRIIGRKADTIVTGGENVAPAEVEAVLLAHPAVADAAVHGRPDAAWGEALIATVVLHDGLAVGPEELRRHCAGRLARFKVPKTVQFAERLPRTPTGKLLRRELK